MSLNPQTENDISYATHTWNLFDGCKHDCRWQMSDQTTAYCYAKAIAERFRSPKFFPNGFETHYFNAERLDDPLRLKKEARIFATSMADWMGVWVPREQVLKGIDVMRRAHWHQFLMLTKNAPRLLQFEWPRNVWIGVSAPPSQMNGKALDLDQQKRMVAKQLEVLAQIKVPVRWMSIEPLSFDIADLIKGAPLEWAVIGAASKGRRTYQPRAEWVYKLLDVLDTNGTKVFFKNELKWPASQWRSEYPNYPKMEQLSLL